MFVDCACVLFLCVCGLVLLFDVGSCLFVFCFFVVSVCVRFVVLVCGWLLFVCVLCVSLLLVCVVRVCLVLVVV